MMKKIILFSVFTVFLFALSSCSQCYECVSESDITDEDGNVIGTAPNEEEFCTADQGEVKAREDEGATCRSI